MKKALKPLADLLRTPLWPAMASTLLTHIPAIVLLLALLSIGFSTWHLSSISRISISTWQPKLNSISSGLDSVDNATTLDHEVENATQAIAGNSNTDNDTSEEREKAKAYALKMVEEQVAIQRSWAAKGRNATARKTCHGRGIYVYDLPPKFNKELLTRCNDFLSETDLCEYLANDGMGQPIPHLGKGWYKTHQFSLEPIFHQRILNHPCRVSDYNASKLFYVPFYGGLDLLRWHFRNVSADVKDALGVELIEWLAARSPWARSSGRDHIFVLGLISYDFRRNGSWGSNFLSLEPMHAPYRFLIERQPWKLNDIGIPYPTHFHPHGDAQILSWQRRIISSLRRNPVSFAAAARSAAAGSIRPRLIKQCMSSSGYCRFLDCAAGDCLSPDAVINLFTESEFCLQPPGDSPTRKSVFDSLVSGCIPVFFDRLTAYYQYPWHLPADHHRYSVFVDEKQVREGKVHVIERLKEVPLKQRVEMRRYIVYELMPGLVYGDASSKFEKFRDAFDITMENAISRVLGAK